jgi:hypothetical protein
LSYTSPPYEHKFDTTIHGSIMFVYWTLVQYGKKVILGRNRNSNAETEWHALRLSARYIKGSSEVMSVCYANLVG